MATGKLMDVHSFGSSHHVHARILRRTSSGVATIKSRARQRCERSSMRTALVLQHRTRPRPLGPRRCPGVTPGTAATRTDLAMTPPPGGRLPGLRPTGPSDAGLHIGHAPLVAALKDAGGECLATGDFDRHDQ